MDWMIASTMVIGGWMMLSVLSGERITREMQISNEIAAKTAAGEQPTETGKK